MNDTDYSDFSERHRYNARAGVYTLAGGTAVLLCLLVLAVGLVAVAGCGSTEPETDKRKVTPTLTVTAIPLDPTPTPTLAPALPTPEPTIPEPIPSGVPSAIVTAIVTVVVTVEPVPTAQPTAPQPVPTLALLTYARAGWAVRYDKGVMERVSRIRGLPVVPYMASTWDCWRIGQWAVARVNGQVRSFRLTDCSHPRDRSRHIKQGLVLEVNWSAGVELFPNSGRAPAQIIRFGSRAE